MRPAHEWAVIAGEVNDIGSIYRGYVAPLAAIPVVALLVGLAVAGGRFLGAAGLVTAATAACASYAMTLAIPLAAAVILEHLAPRFKSDGGTLQFFKLLAYASTPAWLAGVFQVTFASARLAVLGWPWSAYLFFIGSSTLVGTPVEQRVPFTLVAAITVLVLQLALSWAASLAGIPHFGV
jgi:hypothetical protein